MQVIRPSPGVKILRLLQCHVCHVPRDHGKVYHRTDTRTHTPTDTHCVCLVRLSVVCCSSGPSIRLAARARSPQQEHKIFLET